MRFGTWNCRGAFAKYGETALAELSPDVLVVPEARATNTADGWQCIHHPYLDKGTGVFIRNGWVVEAIESPDGFERDWLIPLRVKPPRSAINSFVVLAFWALGGRSTKMPSYTDQFADVLAAWHSVIAGEPTLIAGDFNASGRSLKHLVNLDNAVDLGLVSAFHEVRGVDPGSEAAEEMTLRWIGRGKVEFRYHSDLVLLPRTWTPAIRSVSVGSWENWILTGRSDHAPVMTELDDGLLPI